MSIRCCFSRNGVGVGKQYTQKKKKYIETLSQLVSTLFLVPEKKSSVTFPSCLILAVSHKKEQGKLGSGQKVCWIPWVPQRQDCSVSHTIFQTQFILVLVLLGKCLFALFAMLRQFCKSVGLLSSRPSPSI